MIGSDLQADILGKALSSGGEYADVFAESRRVTSLVIEDARLEKIVTGTETGAGIRLLHNNKTSYSFSNDLAPGALLRAAAEVSRITTGKPHREIRGLAERTCSAEFGILTFPGDVPLA